MSDANVTDPNVSEVDVDAEGADGADDVDTDGGDDADEREYRAEMAKIRGKEKERKEALKKEEAENEGDDEEEGEDGQQKKSEKKQAVEKFKVNGREVEFDMNDTAKVRTAIQKGLAADEKFAHAADIQRNAGRFIENLKKDPFKVLENPKLGLTEDQLRDAAERWLYGKYEYAKMSTEERTALKDKQELEQLRKDRDEKRKADEKQKADQKKEALRQDWSVKIETSLKDAKVPITDWSIQRMAGYARAAISKREQPDMAHIAQQVRADFAKAQRDYFANLTDEELVAEVGQENADRIRRSQLQKFKDGQGRQQPPRQQSAPAQQQRAPRKYYGSAEEMRDDITRRRR